MISFSQMEQKFGTAAAYYCLLEIEKAARVLSWTMADLDFETRLRNACAIQDAMLAHQAADSLLVPRAA